MGSLLPFCLLLLNVLYKRLFLHHYLNVSKPQSSILSSLFIILYKLFLNLTTSNMLMTLKFLFLAWTIYCVSSILYPRASQTQCYPHFCTKTWSSSYIPYLIRKHHHEASLPSQKYVIHPNSSPSVFPNLNNNDVMPPRNHICSLLSIPWGNALVQHSWFLTRITMSFKMSPYFQTYLL